MEERNLERVLLGKFFHFCGVFVAANITPLHLCRQIFRRRIIPTHENRHALTRSIFSLISDTELMEHGYTHAHMQMAEPSGCSRKAQAARGSIATSGFSLLPFTLTKSILLFVQPFFWRTSCAAEQQRRCAFVDFVLRIFP